jgi:hypothetical protein
MHEGAASRAKVLARPSSGESSGRKRSPGKQAIAGAKAPGAKSWGLWIARHRRNAPAGSRFRLPQKNFFCFNFARELNAGSARRDQWDISTGTVMEVRIPRVAPPRMNSRRRE